MNKLETPKRDIDQNRFAENIGGFFHDFLRAAGITMTPGNTMERVRVIGEKMGQSIGDFSEKKSIHIIKQLQDNVAEGFVKMETSFNKVKDLQASTSAALLNVLEDLKQSQDAIKDLQYRLQKLENRQPIDGVMGSTSYDKSN